MTYEGEHRKILLRGIEHHAANGVEQDGGMNEVVNMLPRNGSYVPYSPTDVQTGYDALLPNARYARVHHTSSGDNVVIVYPDSYRIIREVEVPGGGKSYVSILVGGDVVVSKTIRDIVFIGNRMDLSTEDGIEHWLWKNGAYVNVDDLQSHLSDHTNLPSVSFKVERGIFDGSQVYMRASYVKLHKHYTDAPTNDWAATFPEALKYVRDNGSIGGDASALLDSIRFAGGITGYVLVAATYRLKGSSPSNPHYVMASPIMLMGAPEIYVKDGEYHQLPSDISMAKPNKPFFIDDFHFEDYNGTSINYLARYESFRALWNRTDTDDREMKDVTENEHVNIKLSTSTDGPMLRQHNNRTDEDMTQGADGPEIVVPALYSTKYAVCYNHGEGGLSDDSEQRGIRETHGTANSLLFRVNKTMEDKYKDEIDCLCIFISPVISPYKRLDSAGVRMESECADDPAKRFLFLLSDSAAVYMSNYMAGTFTPVMKSVSEIEEEISNIVGLYKVKEVRMNNLDEGSWVRVDLSGGKLATDRLVQHSDTMLKISDMQPIGFTNGRLFGYNERLHVYNFQKDDVYRLQYESAGYEGGAGQYAALQDGNIYEYAIEVTDSNDSVIVHRFTSECGSLNPLSCCADIDAKRVRIFARCAYTNLGVTKYYTGSVDYTKLKTLGGIASFGLKANLKPLDMVFVSEVTYDVYNHYFDGLVDDIKPDSRAYGKNELRVSETGTTLFEVNKSYSFGHGEILGLARMTMGLSQDNYGKQPLVVFCSDGIYTLGVSVTGEYAYTGQTPLSRVVCTNVNGICEIDGAVLFPSEYGLQMVTSDGLKAIALQAAGKHMNLPIVADGLGIYRGAITHAQIVNVLSATDNMDFLDYIQNSNTYIRYIHALNAAIIYNSQKQYAYLLDLATWSVTKLGMKVLLDDNDYPKQLFRVIHNYERSVRFDYYSGRDNTMVLLATRPILLETTQLKTAYRTVLRGVYDHIKESPGGQAESDMYAGLYVFGSQDGEYWEYINGYEKKLTDNRFYDMGVETHRVSYKYLMVVFAANLSKDSHVDGLEMTSREKYNNKLK